jgi:hypothetical protein
MVSEDPSSGSLVDQRPDLVVHIPDAAVHIPEAEERPEAPPIVIEDRPVPWIERREAPWVLLAVIAVVIAVLVLTQGTTATGVSATPGTGDGGSGAVIPVTPTWTALSVPVPESLRTHTANIEGSVDALQIAALGPGAAQSYIGNVATADGPTVQQVYGDNAFSISSPAGGVVIAFLPYPAGQAPVAGQEVTFVGTLMPVPDDFAAMVGPEAAVIGSLTDVFVRVTPETLRVVTPIPETS